VDNKSRQPTPGVRLCCISSYWPGVERVAAMTSKLKLTWLVPILITIHNVEEAVFMPAALARRNASIPNPLHGLLPPISNFCWLC
jgi:hypothetical protein